jgi:hypothetical protein
MKADSRSSTISFITAPPGGHCPQYRIGTNLFHIGGPAAQLRVALSRHPEVCLASSETKVALAEAVQAQGLGYLMKDGEPLRTS